MSTKSIVVDASVALKWRLKDEEATTQAIPFEKHHLEFLSDPDRAQAHLEIALEEYARDQNTSALLLALKDIAAAHS